MKLTKTKISNIYKYYKLCFQNWVRGNGFHLPEPPLRLIYFYEYCHKVIKGLPKKDYIEAYELELVDGASTHNFYSREEYAKAFINAFNDLYIENKPW